MNNQKNLALDVLSAIGGSSARVTIDEFVLVERKGQPMELRYVAASPLQPEGRSTRSSSWVWPGEKLKRSGLHFFLASVFSLLAATGHAAAIKVLCDSPLQPALTKVADVFRRDTNNQVTLTCDAGPAIKKTIEDGAVADVVVVEPDFVAELTNSGKVRVGNRPLIGHVGVGLGNRTDSPAHDISSIEKFKSTLVGADLIVFNRVKSGEAFAQVLERLGIAETLKPKIVRTAPLDVFEPVLKGKGNDMAAGTIPLILTMPGIKLLGPLPGQLQSSIPYTAAVMTNAPQPTFAESFIRFLVSPKGKETLAANGAT